MTNKPSKWSGMFKVRPRGAVNSGPVASQGSGPEPYISPAFTPMERAAARQVGASLRGNYRDIAGIAGTQGLGRPAADGITGVRAVDKAQRERYLWALRASAPANWLSDHLREDFSLVGAVYVAVKVLADQAAQSLVKASKWHPDARQAEDQDAKIGLPRTHELVRLLVRPNTQETWGILVRRVCQQLCLTGSYLGWRVDDGWDMPAEIWTVPTGTYTPLPPSPVYPRGGYRVQPYFPGPLAMIPGAWSAGGALVPAEQMLVMRMPHPLVQWEGLSPLTACGLAVDTINSIDRARMSMTRRMVTPSAVAKVDSEVTFPDDEELLRIQLQYQKIYGGPDRAGGLLIPGPGMEIRPWTPGADGHQEVGWVESWGQLVGFVMAVIGVTKSVGFMNEDSSYAQLYASLKQFNLLSLTPLLQMIADYTNLQLVWPFWGEEYLLELEPVKIDDEDLDLRKLDLLGKYSCLTVNQLLVALGHAPTQEKWGNDRIGQQPQGPGAGGLGQSAALGGMFGNGQARHEGQDVDAQQGGEREQAHAIEQTRPDNREGADSQGPKPERRSTLGKHLCPAEKRKHWQERRALVLNGKAHLNGSVK